MTPVTALQVDWNYRYCGNPGALQWREQLHQKGRGGYALELPAYDLQAGLRPVFHDGRAGAADDDSPENVDSSDDGAGGKAQGTDKIPVVTAVKDMFASVKSNDMTSFKAWLDAAVTVSTKRSTLSSTATA